MLDKRVCCGTPFCYDGNLLLKPVESTDKILSANKVGLVFLSQQELKSAMLLLFRSLNRTLDLPVEGTHARKSSNKFGISLAYSYLCAEE